MLGPARNAQAILSKKVGAVLVAIAFEGNVAKASAGFGRVADNLCRLGEWFEMIGNDPFGMRTSIDETSSAKGIQRNAVGEKIEVLGANRLKEGGSSVRESLPNIVRAERIDDAEGATAQPFDLSKDNEADGRAISRRDSEEGITIERVSEVAIFEVGKGFARGDAGRLFPGELAPERSPSGVVNEFADDEIRIRKGGRD